MYKGLLNRELRLRYKAKKNGLRIRKYSGRGLGKQVIDYILLSGRRT